MTLIGCSTNSSMSRVQGNAAGLNVALPICTVAADTTPQGSIWVSTRTFPPGVSTENDCLLCSARGAQVTGKYPQSVTGGFSLAPVGIPDPQAEVRRIGILECQDAVASNALPAITYPSDAFGRQLEGQFSRIQHDVLVAQSVTLEESVTSCTVRISSYYAPAKSEAVLHVQTGPDHHEIAGRDAVHDVESPAHR